MSLEENKLLLRRLIEGTINERNLAKVDELAPDYVFHDAGNPIHGPEAFKQVVGAFLTAFPDLRLTVDDQIAEGDQVLTRFSMRGTHRGAFMGLAPTGKAVTITGLLLSRIRGGKVVEEWEICDTLGLLQQIGAFTP